MGAAAVSLVVAAAFAHAGWNFFAKRAGSGGAVFVWLTATCSAVLYAPIAVLSVFWTGLPGWRAGLLGVLVSAAIHLGYFVLLQRGYAAGDMSVVYPLARGTGPLLAMVIAVVLLGERPAAIGVLGALQPLLRELRSGTRRSRQDAALALYHLTLVQSNRVKLMKLGAVGVLLGLLKDAEVAARVVLVVCNLASCDEGRAALLDAKAVEILVNLLRSESESVTDSTRENCVATLHSLSHRSLRFKWLARAAGAAEVLRDVAEKGSKRARENARRILEGLREPADGGDEVDWEAVMKDGVSRAGYRVGKSDGANSTEF